MPEESGSSPRRVNVWSAFVPIVAAGAGFLFATSGAIAQGTNLRSDSADLPDVIRSRIHNNTQLSQELTDLTRAVEQGTALMTPDNEALQNLDREAGALAAEAGRTAVAGPTIEVTLTDSPRTLESLPEGFTVDDIVVHQQDVQAVVNALWAGGAEAMMIQDQRVISTSAVRCVGNTLILQGRVYSPPYRIRAIGDVTKLSKSLAQSKEIGIYRELASLIGLGYTVRTAANATFPAYSGSITPAYAVDGSITDPQARLAPEGVEPDDGGGDKGDGNDKGGNDKTDGVKRMGDEQEDDPS